MIYAYLCDNNKYYITNNKIKELNLFLRTFKPIKIIAEYDTEDILEEDKITIEYMERYGINNVRGGIYPNLILEDWQIKIINNQMILNNNNPVFNDYNNYLAKFNTIDLINNEINNLKHIQYQITILIKQINETDYIKIDMINDFASNALQKEILDLLQTEYNRNKNNIIEYKIKDIESKLNKDLISYLILKIDHLYKLYIRTSLTTEYKDYELKILEIVIFNLEKKKELNDIYKNYGDYQIIKNKLIKLYTKKFELLNNS